MASTILVIEAHESVRTLLAQVLTDAGYQVYEAVTGWQGLQQFLTQPTDLVITDLEMPEMNGLEVILALTRTVSNVKGIVMSGHSVDELQKARLLGARQIFAKPLDLPALLHGIQYELQH